MAFDPTGQLGLDERLTYTDVLPSAQTGLNLGDDVQIVLSYNPSNPTGYASSWIKGWKGSRHWVRVGFENYRKDTTTGLWQPRFGTNGQTAYPVLVKHCGEMTPCAVCYAAGSLKDAVTANLYAFWGGLWNFAGVTMRYDTGLAGETGGVWRFSNWAKTYSYDYLSPEESGFDYDVFVPYVTASLAVGTTATGYARSYPAAVEISGTQGYSSGNPAATRSTGTLQSTGVTYTCTQVTPTHKWSHP